MNTHPDFEELLKLLEENGVEYMIVGGYAVAYHGHARFTNDMDLFFRPTSENVHRLRKALVRFGFREEDLPLKNFLEEGNILTFGVEPTRIDLMNKIDGISFEKAASGVVHGRYGEVEVTFIGYKELLENKKSTQRIKDRADLEQLEG